MKTGTLFDSPKYKSFTKDRNQALERVNLNAQTDLSRILFEALDSITGFVSHMGIQGNMNVMHMTFLTRQLDLYIETQFSKIMPVLERRIMRMRKATFILTYIGELEAVARATKKTKHLNSMDFKHKISKQLQSPTLNNQQWNKRIWLVLSKMRHKIIQAFQKALILEISPKEVVDMVKNAYPQVQAYKMPPRALKVVREADKPKNPDDDQEFDFYTGLTNDDDWNMAVQAYKDTELPPSRFDNSQFSYDSEGGYYQYNWELEQDVTDDFVKQVRDGQVEAASDLGVKDFVWVAVIDKKTCDACCLPRNGKTSSEIQSMLSNGELDKEACDAVTPPAHPNCRCDIAPVASVDEVPGPNWKDFNDWLDS